MSERFYVSGPLQPGSVVLEGSEARHLATVCRLQRGDAVHLFNGDGREYAAVVASADRHHVILDVQGSETPLRELAVDLEVAVPLPKGDRAQFLVEKLTELGVRRLVPLRTARSIIHPREGKREKLERWVIEACKQCGRNRLMEIASLTDWSAYCRRADQAEQRWIAHPVKAGSDLAKLGVPAPASQLTVAIGPEGGFSDDELAIALAAGWQAIDLGPRILRVETAALALAAWMSLGTPNLEASRER